MLAALNASIAVMTTLQRRFARLFISSPFLNSNVRGGARMNNGPRADAEQTKAPWRGRANYTAFPNEFQKFARKKARDDLRQCVGSLLRYQHQLSWMWNVSHSERFGDVRRIGASRVSCVPSLNQRNETGLI